MIQKSVCGCIVTPLDGDYHLPKMVLDGKCSKSPVTTGLPTHKTNLIFIPILIEITCKVDPQAHFALLQVHTLRLNVAFMSWSKIYEHLLQEKTI